MRTVQRFDLMIDHARVVTCDGPDTSPTERLGQLDGASVGVRAGRIAYVGPPVNADSARRIDARGRVVLPGLVDPHTHLVFAGSRVDEMARRMAGEDYRAIAAAGGGIKATVRATRAATDEALYATARARALSLRSRGVTSVEIKSGYGLTIEDELRQLAVARRLDAEGVIRVTTSLLGAHAVPPEYRHDRAGYVALVAERMIPEAAARGLADACDVYLDDGAFTAEEARTLFVAAHEAGLAVRGHVGQFADLGGAELVAEFGGLSADHLEHVSDAGLRAMAAADVTAVLLPGAWRTLRQTAPDAERMRGFGVRVAVGTDLNPGTSACPDLALAAALAVRDAGLTLEEALLSITVDAARAAGLSDAGRIAVGLPADLVIFDEEDPRALPYSLGGPLPCTTILGGRIAFQRALATPLW